MRSKNATSMLCCSSNIFALSVAWTDLRRTVRKCQFHLTLSVKKISTNLTINWKMILIAIFSRSNLAVGDLNPDQEDPSYAIVRRTPWLEWKKASIHLCLMTSEERQLVVLSLFFRIPFFTSVCWLLINSSSSVYFWIQRKAFVAFWLQLILAPKE